MGSIARRLKMSPRDEWSPAYVAAAFVIWGALTVSFRTRSSFDILVFLIGLLFAVFCAGRAAFDLLTLRLRHLMSVAAALVTFALKPAVTPPLNSWLDDIAFRRHRSAYDAMVETERALRTGSEPIRMVVEVEDRTLLATNNVFYVVIYDETDEVKSSIQPLREYWPYPRSSTGVTDVGWGIHKNIHHIDGHYYRYIASD